MDKTQQKEKKEKLKQEILNSIDLIADELLNENDIVLRFIKRDTNVCVLSQKNKKLL